MDENTVKSLQTTAQDNNIIISNNNIGHDEERNINIESSETDILYKYQQAHERRIKNGQNNSGKPTKRYGENAPGGHNSSITTHPTCLRESFYLLFAWFGYIIHITFALLPNNVFGGETTLNDFYKNYKLEIAPANWNVVQFGIQLLWHGILLTYLSLIIAEHTVKIFPKGFYYGLGIANICVAIWNICTEYKSYLGRAISWLSIAICLFYSNYILLKHIYLIYDVTKYDASRFRLDSIVSENINKQNNNNNNNNINNQLPPPPLTISSVNNTNEKSKHSTNKKNISSVIGRIQTGGSLNNSPISMSMAPSAAQKLVYDRAAEAHETDNDWLETKITDVTRLKYAGLIGIVFNGISYFLSVVCLQFWIQFGVWLKYACNVKDNSASVTVLIMIFINIIIYYYFDFYYLQKYFMDNFATHIVFCITFTAMIWDSIFPDNNEKVKYTFSVVFQIILLTIVVIGFIIKIIVSIGIHSKYKHGKVNQNNDQYKRVI